MQPKRFSEYTPITEANGSEILPIVKDGQNEVIKTQDLPISLDTQAALDTKPDTSSLPEVAITGNYQDLVNKPVIPDEVGGDLAGNLPNPTVTGAHFGVGGFTLVDANGIVRCYTANEDGSLHFERVSSPGSSNTFGTPFGQLVLA